MRLRALIVVAARRTLGYRTVLWALGLAVVWSGVLGVVLPYNFARSINAGEWREFATAELLDDLQVDQVFVRSEVHRHLTEPWWNNLIGFVQTWRRMGCSAYIVDKSRAHYLKYARLKGSEPDFPTLLLLSGSRPVQETIERLLAEMARPDWLVYMECGFPFVQQHGCFVYGYTALGGRQASTKRYDTGVLFLGDSRSRPDIHGVCKEKPLPTQIKPLGLLLNVLCYAGVMLVVVSAFNLVRVVHRDARGVCVHCGYPRGPGRCPECGREVP